MFGSKKFVFSGPCAVCSWPVAREMFMARGASLCLNDVFIRIINKSVIRLIFLSVSCGRRVVLIVGVQSSCHYCCYSRLFTNSYLRGPRGSCTVISTWDERRRHYVMQGCHRREHKVALVKSLFVSFCFRKYASRRSPRPGSEGLSVFGKQIAISDFLAIRWRLCPAQRSDSMGVGPVLSRITLK